MIYIDVDPVAFSIGSIRVAWYGIMVALAVLTLVIWAILSVKRGAKLNYETVINAAIIGIPSGIIFSRLLHVIDFWDYFMEHPGEIIGGRGLTIYGAVLGAALGIWIYSLFSKKFSFGWAVEIPGVKDEQYTIIPKIDGQLNLFYMELLADVKDRDGRKVGFCVVELLPGVYNDISALDAFARARS